MHFVGITKKNRFSDVDPLRVSAKVRPIFWVVLVLSVAAGGIVLLSFSGLVPLKENEYPAIVPYGEKEVRNVTYQFSFHSQNHSVTFPVEMPVYLGAKRSLKEAHLFTHKPPEEILQEYYSSFINDRYQESLYGEILGDMRFIRDSCNLNDDEYLELLVAFVRSIPFEGDFNETGVKFPVETVIEGGDCDDRSVLLIGLMTREGYDAALLYFDGKYHTAVGVRDGAGRGNYGGYTYIETTASLPIGVIATGLANGDTLDTEPRVIRFGNGTKRYYSGEIGSDVSRGMNRR
ncbi:hypothetical protein [Methanofollis ethanolicus]|uniref:hypothetical protein n=1 Tax=Methanofollis ethanolicus TaxID=488124 RepID=UPI001365D3C9|nr:hypothetical protein [Methanofollis ethanolicus]